MTRLLIATIFLFGFQSKSSLPTIEINSVNVDILTRFRIDCSKFKESFDKREIKKKKIRGQGQINELISELEKLEIVDSIKMTDTRATITIKYSDHTETICADKFSIYRNGTCYLITDKLKKIIW